MGLCHLRIGIFEKSVTLEMSKIAYIQRFFSFFVVLRMRLHIHAIELSTFKKMGEISLDQLDSSKFSAPVAPKLCQFSIFQIFYIVTLWQK